MAGGVTPSHHYGTTGFSKPRTEHRHIWVGTQPSAGVLIAWRRDGGAWQAHVVYVEAGRVVVCWLPADMVRPAGERGPATS